MFCSRDKFCLVVVSALALVSLVVSCGRSHSRAPGSDPARPARTDFKPSVPAIDFTIQVGAFTSARRAARLSHQLQGAGLDAYYFIDTDRFYKVRIARFESKNAARRRAQYLQSRGLIEDFYIVSPVPGAQRKGAAATLQANLVKTAHQFIGTPYRWGGASAKTGFDCSGLTMTVYRMNGLQLPRSARSQYKAGRAVSRQALQRGDLVFFATGRRARISHVGIYIGAGQFVHAPGRGKPIRKAKLGNSYFKGRYKGARRYY